ncbi:MAG TPA: RecQ family ATP-dependent DNA helicase, partial [Gemmatimonadales bacterium]|nr:RecQ family ATP-dependent DNA helicase [Gemmatimonadales bacterium]
MAATLEQARALLRQHYGHPDFRQAQLPVVRAVLAGRDTLAVLPTGGGKSVCFQIPAVALGGLTVVVSPLIALMQDQVGAARARGIPAACLTSGLTQASQSAIWAELEAGRLRLLYASPERLRSLAGELQGRGLRPALLAVDEAHCIAEWGHDFRPGFRTLGAARYRLGRPPVVALTGSATPEVRQDIIRTLRFRAPFEEHVGSFDRANLWFGVVAVGSERDRIRALLRLLAGDDRMVIVYAPTRSVTESVAHLLAQAGHRAAPYHAGLTRERRAATLAAFLDDRLDVIVATCAFGMGIDKPRIRLVVHWTMPPTPEAYYQEAGRAGRDGGFARCVLLYRPGDAALHRRQLGVTFPARALLERIWRDGSPPPGTPANVLASADRLRLELQPERGEVDWRRVDQRRRRAADRIAAVEAYARGRGCRRRALIGYFGQALDGCAGCDQCRRHRVTLALAGEAAERLRRLEAAIGRERGAWGTALLEPDVLVDLARSPPADAAALADVPGVGAAVAARWGGAILRALGTHPRSRLGSSVDPILRTTPNRCPQAGPTLEPGGRRAVLLAWRAAAARAAGVPDYVVLGNASLDALSRLTTPPGEPPQAALVAVEGLGPRALAKHGAALLAIVAAHPPDHYLGATDRAGPAAATRAGHGPTG